MKEVLNLKEAMITPGSIYPPSRSLDDPGPGRHLMVIQGGVPYVAAVTRHPGPNDSWFLVILPVEPKEMGEATLLGRRHKVETIYRGHGLVPPWCPPDHQLDLVAALIKLVTGADLHIEFSNRGAIITTQGGEAASISSMVDLRSFLEARVNELRDQVAKAQTEANIAQEILERLP